MASPGRAPRGCRRAPARITATLGLAVGLLVAAPPVVADACPAGDHRSTRTVDDGDHGGSSGTVRLGTSAEPDYLVVFRAEGEELWLHDRDADDRVLEVKVVVTRPDGTLADLVRVNSRDGRHVDLGTPRGSGDITEGHRIWIAISPTGCAWSEAVGFTA